DGGRPTFHLLNVGETHYPYARPDEDPADWPHISGVHGVFRHLDDEIVGGRLTPSEGPFFDPGRLQQLQQRQVDVLAFVDGVFEKLFDLVPSNSWLIVTSDHGELFGEDGYFGHGPIMHEKVFEVPFVEGRIR